jgi:hypothetical protein
MDDRQLSRRAAAGTFGGRLDPRAGLERRTSVGHSLRQQHRSCAVRARGHARRRARRRDLAGLFADVGGFRQAQEHDQAAGARRDLCFEPEAIHRGARSDQAAAFGNDRVRRRRQQRRDFISVACRYPRSRRRRQILRGGDARHHSKIPVHLGLDRFAKSRHQHPAHADLEPAGQGTDLAVSRNRARGSGNSRLAALEPHLRRQSQFQSGAAQRRHAVYRRRQAGAGPSSAR